MTEKENQEKRQRGVLASTAAKLATMAMIMLGILKEEPVVYWIMMTLMIVAIIMDAQMEFYNYGRLEEVR